MNTKAGRSLWLSGASLLFATVFAFASSTQVSSQPSIQGSPPTGLLPPSPSTGASDLPPGNRPSQGPTTSVSPSPQLAAGCSQAEIEKLLNELLGRITLAYNNRDRRLFVSAVDSDALRFYLKFSVRVESCKEWGLWRQALQLAPAPSRADDIRAPLNALLERGNSFGSFGIYVSTGNPAQFRILDVEPSVSPLSIGPQLTLLAEKIERIQGALTFATDKLNGPKAELNQGMGLVGISIVVVLLLLALAGIWAGWRFFFVPNLDELVTLRAQEAVDEHKIGTRIGQLTAQVTQLNNRMQDIRDYIRKLQMPVQAPTVPPSIQKGRPLTESNGNTSISLDAMAAEILADWVDARDDHKPFQNKYSPVGIEGPVSTNGALVITESQRDLAESNLWAISSRQDDTWLIVPTPLLKPSELSVGVNRRARERFEGVFQIERGDTALSALAFAHRIGLEFHVDRLGVLRLPGL